MTNHHDQLRVAPDPSRAEELRQRLHARLASVDQGPVTSIPSADTDPDDREGDLIMLETEDRPTGQDPPTPGRRSPGSWLLVAALIAVVAIVGALLVAAGDDDETQVPATTSTTAPAQDVMVAGESDSALEPGRYFIDPDGDDTTPLRVTYEIAAEGWSFWYGAMKESDVGHSAVSIATVTNLVTDGCTDHDPQVPPVGPSVDDLATALTQLAPFEVTAPPTDVTLLGYSGKHLVLTVPDLPVAADGAFADCADEGTLHSWISPNQGGSFWGYSEPGHREEFWILDVDGTRLVLQKNGSPGTPAQDLAEQQAIFDSIRIEP
jgi:hypothetical protein